jgi:hypothetical protein
LSGADRTAELAREAAAKRDAEARARLREQLTVAALKALIVTDGVLFDDAESVAVEAVRLADATIAALERTS